LVEKMFPFTLGGFGSTGSQAISFLVCMSLWLLGYLIQLLIVFRPETPHHCRQTACCVLKHRTPMSFSIVEAHGVERPSQECLKMSRRGLVKWTTKVSRLQEAAETKVECLTDIRLCSSNGYSDPMRHPEKQPDGAKGLLA
jgi:hypothetical protein